MEYDVNRARRPFIFYILLGRWLRQQWRIWHTRRVLRRLSDEQLKDVGLRRDDVC
ncbi:TPA: DUF1127 domain-containing protein [Pluralibacter gergoviae]|uniref:DUF1127 domain-containing protein n=1 Tax=Pluralibacter gergoviae TaxID=61647 RepID=UPI000907F771|nr:DUF1127 domain-containing protein [Pluralibacter gergoviae]MBL3692761.1 DUF1127 domain-containing protein [Pluralibacter gergoviae]HDS1153423.1 DUF1127 domain-containing protein [Pluralibacter gergoviae]